MKHTYIDYRRRAGRRALWRKIRPAVITVALIGWLYFTARLFAYGIQIRGKFSPGGEIFMLLIPALIWVIVVTWRDMKALVGHNTVNRQKG